MERANGICRGVDPATGLLHKTGVMRVRLSAVKGDHMGLVCNILQQSILT